MNKKPFDEKNIFVLFFFHIYKTMQHIVNTCQNEDPQRHTEIRDPELFPPPLPMNNKTYFGGFSGLRYEPEAQLFRDLHMTPLYTWIVVAFYLLLQLAV